MEFVAGRQLHENLRRGTNGDCGEPQEQDTYCHDHSGEAAVSVSQSNCFIPPLLTTFAECSVLHAKGLAGKALGQRPVRGIRHRFDTRDIASARIQLHSALGAGRTLWQLQQRDRVIVILYWRRAVSLLQFSSSTCLVRRIIRPMLSHLH